MLAVGLADQGFDITTAENGKEALAYVDGEDPDVIVLDLEMPVMDGREFYRELRSRGQDVPVLILSAYNARAAQMELGAEASLDKPFDPTELAARVHELATGP